MIKINIKDLSAGYINGRQIVYFGINGMLFPISRLKLSCYYNGYWIDDYPWTDDTPWTD